MAMAFAYFSSVVIYRSCKRTFFQLTFPLAKPHRAAVLADIDKVAKLEDDRKRRFFVKLGRVRIAQIANITRKLDARGLHSEADTKVRSSRSTRISNGSEHPRDAAFAKAA